MTRTEWDQVVGVMAANWPHQPPSDESIVKWYADLQHLPPEQVLVAVEALYRDGREFCPNGAQILAKVSELGRDDPDHGEAWRLVNDALAKHAPNEWSQFYAALPAAVSEAARRMNFEIQSGYLKDEESTVRAQFRGIYQAVCAERRRDDAYAGLPDAGLRSLKRGPRPAGEAIGRELARLEQAR